MKPALIFDLDGTLLTSTKSVHPETSVSLLTCAKLGFVLVIATARPIRAVERFVIEQLLAQTAIITLNGAVTYPKGPRSRPILNGTLGTNSEALAERLCSMDYYLSVETDGRTFSSNRRQTTETLRNQQATPAEVVDWEDIDFARVSKIAADGEGRSIDVDGYAETFGVDVIPEMSGTFVNFLPKGIDKGSALKAYANQSGLDLHRSIAFGDDLPDIGLFDKVGTGVAMEGSPMELAAIAHHVIGSCDGPSIGDFLKAKFLKRVPVTEGASVKRGLTENRC